MVIRRRRVVWTGGLVRLGRFVGRYVLALFLVPLSVLVGVAGVIQYRWRRWRHGPALRRVPRPDRAGGRRTE